MIEFPYGIADFRRIRRQGMVYVDRPAGIRDLDRLGSILVFLRPRRFGKSLWLRTLANGYDLRRAGEFDELFGGLAIGRQPTPLAHRSVRQPAVCTAVSFNLVLSDIRRHGRGIGEDLAHGCLVEP